MQDKIFFICGLGFVYALVPQLIKTFKTKSAEDFSWHILIITALGMYVVTATLISLKFYWSAAIDLLDAVGWTVIFIAKVKFK